MRPFCGRFLTNSPLEVQVSWIENTFISLGLEQHDLKKVLRIGTSNSYISVDMSLELLLQIEYFCFNVIFE